MTASRAALAGFWGCAVAVLVLALAPDAGAQHFGWGWDKANHAFAFAVLCLLGTVAWPRRTLRLLAALLAYGVAIELLQSLTAGRHADWRDMVANAAGLALAWAVASAARRFLRRG